MADLKKIEKLARDRANQLIESWWHEDRFEFQEEKDLTDEELEQVLNVDVRAYTASDIADFMRRGS